MNDKQKALILYSLIEHASDVSGIDSDPHAETLSILCIKWGLTVESAAKLIVDNQEWFGGFATIERLKEQLNFYIGTD